MALFLNPRLTLEQAMSLHKKQTDHALSLVAKYEVDLAKITNPQHREIYQRYMFPLVMQQLAMCF